MPDLLLSILIAALLSLVILLSLRLLYPAKSSQHKSGRDLISLHQEFRFHGFGQLLVFLLIAALGTLACFGIYQGVAEWLYQQRLEKSELLIRADLFARILAAVVGGAALAFRFSGPLFKRILGDRFSDYVAYQNQLSGMANERASKGISLALLISYALLSMLFLNWYTGFGPQGILQDPLFSFQKREYRYDQIERLERLESYTRPDGKTRELEHYLIHFNNGEVWNSRNSGYEDPLRNRELFESLSKRLDLELEH
jgi:ABC-type multidrug transport system fused ATPase/permease subunit